MKKQSLFRRVGAGIKATERSVARAIDSTQKEFKETVQAVRERDPAARSTAEILLLYSGIRPKSSPFRTSNDTPFKASTLP